MIKSTQILVAAMVFACLSVGHWPVHAQVTKKKTEPVKGTVVSIEKAKVGKSYTLTMKAEDDTEYEVPIVPKTLVSVNAKGDAGFVRPGMMFQGKAMDTGEPTEFWVDTPTILVGVAAQPHVTQISQKEDEENFSLCGKILAIKKQQGDGEGDVWNVDCGTRTVTVGCLTTESPITVSLADPSFIKEGDAVEIDGTIIKSRKQITAKAVVVTATESITSEDYFAAIADAKKSKTAKSSSSKSKSKTETKSDEDPEPADKAAKTKNTPPKSGAADASDPFGVLKGKKSTKPKTEKSETPSDAKKEDAKDTNKKSE